MQIIFDYNSSSDNVPTLTRLWLDSLDLLIFSARIFDPISNVEQCFQVFSQESSRSCIFVRPRPSLAYHRDIVITPPPKLSQTLEPSIFWSPSGLIWHDEWLVTSRPTLVPTPLERKVQTCCYCAALARVRGFKHTPECNCLPLTRSLLQPVVDEDLMMRPGYNVCCATWDMGWWWSNDRVHFES